MLSSLFQLIVLQVPNATICNGPVFDIGLAFFGGRPPTIHHHNANFNHLCHPAGNMIQFARGLDVARLRLITLRSAETLRFAHSIGVVHGNVGPGAFLLHADCITLLDVGLYKLAQKEQNYIPLTPSHNYKARAELMMDPVVPSVAMDVHAWGKTIFSLFTGSALVTSLGTLRPLAKPAQMPHNIWNVVVQCLDENLNIHTNMEQIVGQLAVIVNSFITFPSAR
ncbi:hypothetical protein BDQ17DRAFT_493133 [Cyathus striatus]|nr:hypothetical protein BDQ17DRAFT_493133 [Cyathus striatus]